jgi:hypothetical protein
VVLCWSVGLLFVFVFFVSFMYSMALEWHGAGLTWRWHSMALDSHGAGIAWALD